MSISQNWIDEVLEAIWVARETGKESIDEIKIICADDATNSIDMESVIEEIKNRNLITVKDDAIHLLPEGEKLAGMIIRRHRLAERLLTDVLNVSELSMEFTACQFEHILNPEVTDSVCSFLGHPPYCPHGKPIPPGECCSAFQNNQVKPLIVRLSNFDLGKEGKIAFITPSFHKRFDRLTALGVIPGNPIIVHQRTPSFVVRIGETEIALDKTVAHEIYVKAS